MTHNRLTIAGAKWLKKHQENVLVPNCTLVLTEQKSITNEIADVIGWCSWGSVLIEVKTSRADFLKDKKKHFRNSPNLGIGEFRYYLCPKGLIQIADLPRNWGLLYFHESKISIEKKSLKNYCNFKNERSVLLSYFRQI